MNYSDFIYDFNLYLCERFGYRNCCSVIHNANGICVSVHVGEMDLYIRFWEYSCGVGSIPDWSIIIVRSNFKRNQQENLKDLARFSGLKASIITDVVQLGIILMGGALLVVLSLRMTGGFDTVRAGLGAVSGEYTSLTSSTGIEVLLG